MSTKSHLYFSLKTELEIYHETSEPVSFWGKHQGYNIYLFIPFNQIKEWKMKEDHLYIDLYPDNEIFPEKIKFFGGWLVEVTGDNECLLLIIEGGSPYDKKLSEGNYKFFDINDHKLY